LIGKQLLPLVDERSSGGIFGNGADFVLEAHLSEAYEYGISTNLLLPP
jgi:hypothetical protein